MAQPCEHLIAKLIQTVWQKWNNSMVGVSSIGLLIMMLTFTSKGEVVDIYLLCEKSSSIAKNYANKYTLKELQELRSTYSNTTNYSQWVSLHPIDAKPYVDELMTRQGISRSDAENTYFNTSKRFVIGRVQVAIDSKLQEDEIKYWNQVYKSCVGR
ncbi:hypothetical protein WOC08_23975 [Vibrio parahaemolyticus]|nr:hypothetical protein [Vibrio parahaemolyticus]HCG9220667.1 hypothetical protein [Vibrio parahaemolyticus]